MKTQMRYAAFRTRIWHKGGHNRFHRRHGPAIEYTNGNKHWYVENDLVASESGAGRTVWKNEVLPP